MHEADATATVSGSATAGASVPARVALDTRRPVSLPLAYLGLSVATLGWAAAFVVGKLVLTGMTPLAVGLWRYVLAAAVLLPFAVRAQRSTRAVPRGETIRLLASRGERHAVGAGTGGRPSGAAPVAAPAERAAQRGRPTASLRSVASPLAVMVVAGGVLYPWLFFAALARTSATNTSLLIALNPVMTLLLTPWIGERLERRELCGTLLAFCGAVTVITHGDPTRLLALDLDPGDLMALAAAACWAGFNLASRSVVDGIAPSVANCFVFVGGAAALLAIGWSESPLDQLATATPAVLAGIVCMAVVSSVVSGQLFLLGVRTAGVGRSVLFVYLVPVLTAALSGAILGEHLVAAQAVGGATVLLGLFAATRPRS